MKILKIILVFIIVLVLLGLGLNYYIGYKMSQVPSLTYEEALDYILKDNEKAKVTVGMIKDGKATFEVYGNNSQVLPKEKYIYEIGSISKTFLGAMVSKAELEGKLKLEENLNDVLFDKSLNISTPTIKELVTHTSGYKNYYLNKVLIFKIFSSENGFKDITKEMMLNEAKKNVPKDKEYPFNYSNFGISVVGQVLEKKYNKSFYELLDEYIKKDLKLNNTKVAEGKGNLEKYWQWNKDDAYLPAGAITSDIDDMLSYLKINMDESLPEIKKSHEKLLLSNYNNKSYENMGIKITGIGTTWMINEDENIIWHNGGTDNCNTYIGFDKEKKIGVVIMANLSSEERLPTTTVGVKLLQKLRK